MFVCLGEEGDTDSTCLISFYSLDYLCVLRLSVTSDFISWADFLNWKYSAAVILLWNSRKCCTLNPSSDSLFRM